MPLVDSGGDATTPAGLTGCSCPDPTIVAHLSHQGLFLSLVSYGQKYSHRRTLTEELLTSAEVAQLFRVSTKTVSRWARLGQLPVIRTPSGQLRFRRRDVDEFIRRQNDPQS